MSEAPEAAASAPVPIHSRAEAWAAILASVKDLLPAVALSVGLCLLVFFAVPAANHDPVLSIISGMLGFLTGRATSPAKTDPPKS